MKVSLVLVDLSENTLPRVYPIAKILERHFEVEILGLFFGDGILRYYRDEFHYKALPGGDFPGVCKNLRALYDMIDGDVVYASKPRLTSYGLGLLAKVRTHKPLLLDIDDFDTASLYRNDVATDTLTLNRHRFLHEMLFNRWLSPKSLRYEYIVEKFISAADQITVASNFLRTRYGGVRLPHGVNTDVFAPGLYDRGQVRQRLNIDPSQRVILFAGTPRPHKGLIDLAQAMNALPDRHNLLLVVVGGDQGNMEVERARATTNRGAIIHVESQHRSEIPTFLAAADLVVLPQQDSWVARAQVPVKLFEAMAMAKPIVASAVSDIPEILEGCGLTFRPGDIDAMAQQMGTLCDDPGLAQQLGHNAREKAVAHYSWDVMEATLMNEVLKPWI